MKNRPEEAAPSIGGRIMGLLSSGLFYVVCGLVVAAIIYFVGVGTLRTMIERVIHR